MFCSFSGARFLNSTFFYIDTFLKNLHTFVYQFIATMRQTIYNCPTQRVRASINTQDTFFIVVFHVLFI